jgi:squalene cyclase
VLSSTATRRRMSGVSRTYACLRSTSSVSLDALGAQAGRWSLSRFLERCSWSHIVSRRIFVSCAYKAKGLTSGTIAVRQENAAHM